MFTLRIITQLLPFVKSDCEFCDLVYPAGYKQAQLFYFLEKQAALANGLRCGWVEACGQRVGSVGWSAVDAVQGVFVPVQLGQGLVSQGFCMVGILPSRATVRS